VKITTQKLDLTNVKSKCGSLKNSKHTPKGGNVKIKSRRSDWSGVTSRCGTFDNVSHVAGGGDVKVAIFNFLPFYF
jgi:microtubule-associated protein tau